MNDNKLIESFLFILALAMLGLMWNDQGLREVLDVPLASVLGALATTVRSGN